MSVHALYYHVYIFFIQDCNHIHKISCQSLGYCKLLTFIETCWFPRIIMEEEMLSIISNGETNVIPELSDSISSTPLIPATKRLRHASAVSKFKGVVPQQNGHWGAQIYANHQRIWLGTFKSEKDAAMAYDSAAIRLRSVDSHRNFLWTKITIEEPNFQSHYSTEAVINMIRDGSYSSRFADFLRSHSRTLEEDVIFSQMRAGTDGWMMCRQLFQKELTPSDVGKLNRLVIPKKYAVKYFPQISERVEEHAENDKADDVQLVFHDKSMKLWKFRYCYWKSSQSFVFTRGWNRFVKEKQLKANDTICFYLCELRDIAKGTKTFCMIDANKGENSGASAEVSGPYVDMKVDLQLQLGQNIVDDKKENKVEEDDNGNEIEAAEEVELKVPSSTSDSERKLFKLFGVEIF